MPFWEIVMDGDNKQILGRYNTFATIYKIKIAAYSTLVSISFAWRSPAPSSFFMMGLHFILLISKLLLELKHMRL